MYFIMKIDWTVGYKPIQVLSSVKVHQLIVIYRAANGNIYIYISPSMWTYIYHLWLTQYAYFQGVFIFYIVKSEPVKYLKYEYPPWAHGIGGLMALSSVGLIPIYMIYLFIVTPGSFREVFIVYFPLFQT